MGSDLVVIPPPGFDDLASLEQRGEGVLIEALFAQAAVKRFDVAILGRLSGIDEA